MTPRIRSVAALAFAVALVVRQVPSQTPTLLKDFTTTPVANTPGNPIQLGRIGLYTITRAYTPDYGFALYRSVLGSSKPVRFTHFLNQMGTLPFRKLASAPGIPASSVRDQSDGSSLHRASGTLFATLSVMKSVLTGYLPRTTRRHLVRGGRGAPRPDPPAWRRRRSAVFSDTTI